MIHKWLENETKVTLICAIVSAVSLVLSITGMLKSILPIDIAWIAIILSGVPILIGASRAVVFEHDIKADLLVSLALIASVAAKEYFAAGEVALIMQIGSLLEDYTSGKAQEGIEKLIGMTPQTARILRNGKESIVPVEEVKVGDTLSVIAGETVPVDGTILEGETTIDQSVITGESIPVDKRSGDTVQSGTVNLFGTFIMRANAVSGNSSMQRMVRLAKEAEENRAPIVTLADKWATWLVVIALGCAILIWLFTGEYMRAVTTLVVFCPCAFILATPTAVLAGIGNAAKAGIIVRSGEALEKLSKIRTLALDKTGTLTCGKPSVTGVFPACGSCTESELLRLAALAEQKSEHPLGKAICRAFPVEDDEGQAADDFRVLAGQGVSATVDGKQILVGKEDFMRSQGINRGSVTQAGRASSEKGATVVYVAADSCVIGYLALSDSLRENARETIEKLKAVGIRPVLLTGDHEGAARTVADTMGISEVRSDLLPEDKMNIVKEMKLRSQQVCMVGDGVNDALALRSADAGIAMGSIGSDIAIESADAVLVSDDIRRLPYLFRLAQEVIKKIHTNIIASLLINLSAVLLSAFGVLNPVTGALWHNFGSVFVVVNAAMLLRMKDE